MGDDVKLIYPRCFVETCQNPATYNTNDTSQPVCIKHKQMIDGTGFVKVEWEAPPTTKEKKT